MGLHRWYEFEGIWLVPANRNCRSICEFLSSKDSFAANVICSEKVSFKSLFRSSRNHYPSQSARPGNHITRTGILQAKRGIAFICSTPRVESDRGLHDIHKFELPDSNLQTRCAHK
jgi:hypothetical protein